MDLLIIWWSKIYLLIQIWQVLNKVIVGLIWTAQNIAYKINNNWENKHGNNKQFQWKQIQIIIKNGKI